jgi:hypothetical protein
VIVLVVDIVCVWTFKTERDSPIATHRNGPSTFALTFQFVKFKARKAHVLWLYRRLEPTQNQAQFSRMLVPDPRRASSLVETLKAPVSERFDHYTSVTYNVTEVNGGLTPS